MSHPRHELGRRAEAATAAWLTSRGWEVLERRWRSPLGELDLVCLDPNAVLVGVEVKLRTTGRAGTGAESVDRRRLARLRRTLAAYAAGTAASNGHHGMRLDLVSLTPAGDAEAHWRVELVRGVDGW